jgi:hypothetical protein
MGNIENYTVYGITIGNKDQSGQYLVTIHNQDNLEWVTHGRDLNDCREMVKDFLVKQAMICKLCNVALSAARPVEDGQYAVQMGKRFAKNIVEANLSNDSQEMLF